MMEQVNIINNSSHRFATMTLIDYNNVKLFDETVQPFDGIYQTARLFNDSTTDGHYRVESI